MNVKLGPLYLFPFKSAPWCITCELAPWWRCYVSSVLGQPLRCPELADWLLVEPQTPWLLVEPLSPWLLVESLPHDCWSGPVSLAAAAATTRFANPGTRPAWNIPGLLVETCPEAADMLKCFLCSSVQFSERRGWTERGSAPLYPLARVVCTSQTARYSRVDQWCVRKVLIGYQ